MSKPDLTRFYNTESERGGVILTDGTVIEFANLSDNPDREFQPNPEELLQYINDLAATWHTHPNATANLSVEDWNTFISWPDLIHAIVGSDGTRWYKVKGSAVINA